LETGENWKPEFVYAAIVIIDQIKTDVTMLAGLQIVGELSKHKN